MLLVCDYWHIRRAVPCKSYQRRIHSPEPFREELPQYIFANMLEDEIAELPLRDGVVERVVKPFEIVTVKLFF